MPDPDTTHEPVSRSVAERAKTLGLEPGILAAAVYGAAEATGQPATPGLVDVVAAALDTAATAAGAEQTAKQKPPNQDLTARALDLMHTAGIILTGKSPDPPVLSALLLAQAQICATLAVAEATDRLAEPPETETAVETERWGWWCGPARGWALSPDGRVIVADSREQIEQALSVVAGTPREYPGFISPAEWRKTT